jgi:DNA-binding NarL/FixJ family response regulator
VEEPHFTVLLVEDYEPFRRFVVTKLAAQPKLRILSEVCDGAEAVEKAKELQPDLILLDIGLPTVNGIEAARQIQESSPKSKILFVSENRSSDITEEAFRAGGLGYVLKSDAEKDLMLAIDAVLRGERFISATLASHFLVVTTVSVQALSWILTTLTGIH